MGPCAAMGAAAAHGASAGAVRGARGGRRQGREGRARAGRAPDKLGDSLHCPELLTIMKRVGVRICPR